MKRASEPGAAKYLPNKHTLPQLRDAARHCQGCKLFEHATQTVFGEGPAHARLLFIGEQPGNDEDLAGHPFVGPAGRIFDRALEAAEIDRRTSYVTNAVKHFKWEPRGKRRIHKKPTSGEIWACRPWLDAEIASVKPQALVCLGATAAQALFGSSFRVTTERGRLLDSELAPIVMATVHPSSLLRAPTPEDRDREYDRFVADLRSVSRAMAGSRAS
ncbi:MAG TPA: UdgX family uracil-DNA binding protein [Polyangiales bacterium]|jgi:DNA polymerase|nr:UdgX family uracil-DNA binding protein [Polyangiales bacterium]